MKLRVASAITSIVLLASGLSARGQERDDNLAILRSAADAGDPRGLFALGTRFLHGQGVEQDYQQARTCFRQAADQGFAPAQNQLGTMYERGLGVPKDYLGAMNYYRQAANQGYALAQYNLGVLYDTGKGAPVDNQRALEWFRKAANQGQADAEAAIGFYYQRGVAVPQVFAWAADWYRKAADHGSAQAENDLGHLFEAGLGVQQDYEQALTWYYKAAEHGNSFGQTNIGHIYEKGLGLEVDYAQALMWYRRGASQGNLYATNNLGWMYEKGEGVPQDYGRALAWYQVAANQGFKTAIENIERLREQLQATGPAQWDAANRYARQATHEQEERIARASNFGREATELELDASQEEGLAVQMDQSGKGPAASVMDAGRIRMEAQKYRLEAARLRQGVTEADQQQTAGFSARNTSSPVASNPNPAQDMAFNGAVNQTPLAQGDDPPGRVAQLRYIRGPVSFEPAGTDDWTSPSVNRPLTTGDKLWTDQGGRAELSTDSAKIRLNGQTGFSFLNLNDHMTQIRLTEGTIQIHLRRLDDDESFEVDTPNLALSLLRPGNYRLDVNESGDTTAVTVRAGAGEVTSGGLALGVRAGQTGIFAGIDEISQDIEPIESRDDFDNWCLGRDRREEHSLSARYVSPDVIGYEDLDNYGEWRHVPQYGDVWVPTAVPAGWAPYHYGHWTWISPWGWTWVDDAPWGFAPFHYGRWAYVNGYWAWCPGPVAVAQGTVAARPVYAPALVAWVGSAPLGQGNEGGIAWFPLGPREVYVPPYRVSQTYVTNVNVTNTTVTNTYVTNVYNNSTTINNTAINNVNVTNVTYVNKTAPGAVTAVPQSAFTSAQPVAKAAVQVDAKQLAVAKVATNNIVVAPQSKSVLENAAPTATIPKPPDTALNRPVVAKVAPPPQPVPFAVVQKMIQANGGHPVSPAEVQRQQVQQQLPPVTPALVKIAPPVSANGSQTAGNPGQARQTDAKQGQQAETGHSEKDSSNKAVSTTIPRDQAKPATPVTTPNPVREVPAPLAKPQDHANQPQTLGQPPVLQKNEARDERGETGRSEKDSSNKAVSTTIPRDQAKPATPVTTPNPVREVRTPLAKPQDHANQPQMTNVTSKSEVKADSQTQAQPTVPQKSDTRGAVSVSKSPAENKASAGNSPKVPPTTSNDSGNRPPANTDQKDQQKPPETKGKQQEGKQTPQKQKPEGKQPSKPARP